MWPGRTPTDSMTDKLVSMAPSSRPKPAGNEGFVPCLPVCSCFTQLHDTWLPQGGEPHTGVVDLTRGSLSWPQCQPPDTVSRTQNEELACTRPVFKIQLGTVHSWRPQGSRVNITLIFETSLKCPRQVLPRETPRKMWEGLTGPSVGVIWGVPGDLMEL